MILVVLLGTGVAAFSNASTANADAAQDEVLGIAHTLAAAPVVVSGLSAPDPTSVLQPLAEQVQRDTGTDFVVVMTPDGIRYTHPDPAQIGGRFRGTIAPAAAGGTVVETFTGTLGPSVRAVVPVVVAGRVAGLVAVGRTINHVSAEMTRQLPAARRHDGRRTAGGGRRVVAGEPLAAALDARSRAGRAEPDVRVLRRGAARGPRRPVAARPGRPAAAGQRRGPASARRCPTTRSAAGSTSWGSRPRSGRPSRPARSAATRSS